MKLKPLHAPRHMAAASIPESRRIWTRLSASAACARRHQDGGLGVSAPPGFSTRVVAHWRELNQSAKFRLWRRWSLFSSILGSAAACLLMTGHPSLPAHSGSSWNGSENPPAPAPADPFSISIPLP